MRIKIPARRAHIFAALLTIALTNISVLGQIKIPDIFKPKQNPPIQAPAKPSVVLPKAGQPAGISQATGGNYVDDGFTWFEALGFQEYVNGAPVTMGWALKSSIRLIGAFPSRSAFKMVVARAGKPITSTRCEGYPTNTQGVSFLWTIECWKKDTATKEIGKFDVQVFAINGDTDAETLVRTYKIDVLESLCQKLWN